MTRSPTAVPLRPTPATPASTHLVRAAAAHFFAAAHGARDRPLQAAERLWRDDEATPIVIRAAVSPASTTGPGWAQQLAATAVGSFISSLAPKWASGRLIAGGLRVSLDGVQSLAIPEIVASAAAAGSWVAEGGPIPVVSLTVGQSVIGPTKKLASIAVFSETLANASAPAIESIIRQVLTESAGLALDAQLFSANAADATRPAGLLVGATSFTATVGGGAAAMTADVAKLVAAINTAASPVLLVAAVPQATALALAEATVNLDVVASAALPAGTLIAVGLGGFVSAFDSTPEFAASNEGLVHLDNATPLAIGTAGSPNTVAAPSLSLYQNALVATRMVLRAAWTTRGSNVVATISGASWP